MASRELTRAGGLASGIAVLAAAAFYFLLPLTLVIRQAVDGIRPSGFGHGFSTLSKLSAESALLALLPAITATGFATLCSLLGKFAPSFRRFYRKWLLVLLFTNPVFLVFGFTVLFAPLPPFIAVEVATAYVLLPFVGMVAQTAVDDFPAHQVMMARSLGSSAFGVVVRHILPGIGEKLLLAVLLGSVFALGFYLLPSFVGLGRITTLGTVIDHAANRLGDWTAACQLCLIALLTQSVLLIAWQIGRRQVQTDGEG